MQNTEKTYILGNSQIISGLNGNLIEIPNLINENDIHDWVIELFRSYEIEKIVIEIGENVLLSLQIGYHIRLSIEDLQRKSLIPILYVSSVSLNSVLLEAEIYSQILTTKGVFFSNFNLLSINQEIEHLIGLNESEYLTKFLKIIHIQPDETVGRHSLANIWGAYALDKASNVNALAPDSEFKKKLYFKYISAFNDIDKLKPSPLKVLAYINVGSANKIKAVGKKILLIDDEVEKGWETVLRKVFKTSTIDDFVVINEKVKDFEGLSEASKRIIKSIKFDLYLVDLRLNGLDEDDNIKTEAFSGMKVIQEIKSINKGYQVIVFTASNKIWNLKSLLEVGIDGYYLKESPEYNFSRNISEQNYINFKENVEKSFAKNYLSEIYTCLRNTKNIKTNSDSDFIAESDTALNIAWEQINNEYLDFGFLTLFQVIESYADKVSNYDNLSGSFDLIGSTIINNINQNENEWILTYHKDSRNGDYFSSGKLIQQSYIKPTTLYKTSCLLYLKYKKDDTFLKNFGKLNKLRNDIAHGGARNYTTKDNLIEILNILEEIRSY